MVHWSKNFHKSCSLVQQLNSCWYINQRNLVVYCLLLLFTFLFPCSPESCFRQAGLKAREDLLCNIWIYFSPYR